MPLNPELQELEKKIDELALNGWEGKEPERPARRLRLSATQPVRFKRIIVAYDGSEGAKDALAWGRQIAMAHHAEVVVALVLPEQPKLHGGALTGMSEETHARIMELLREDESHAQNILTDAQGLLDEAGVACDTVLTRGNPVTMLVEQVELQGADLLIIGSHGRRGLERVLLGSVADAVKDRVPSSVLIARNAPPVDKILLPVDGSPLSHQAAAVLAGLMPTTQAKVSILHVFPLPFSGFSAQAHELMSETLEDLDELMGRRFEGSDDRVHHQLLFGKPADRIVEYAKDEGCNLIVMGARGLSPLKGLLMGSVSNRVTHRSRASVLLVRGATASPQAGHGKKQQSPKELQA